ncbi:MAG TPA: DNA internalization-related competence protein ComEC/Rec2 [Gammaproteobacteria bacterium]|nr:DNA internalization-related competence protein ComEC/Rec2 [Gammaproteobacteria bacterium]
MLIFALSFLLGDILLQLQSSYPVTFVIYLTAAAGTVCLCFAGNKGYLALTGLLLGFAWTAYCALSDEEWNLNREWEGKPVLVTGFVRSLPIINTFGASFDFEVEKLKVNEITLNKSARIRLSWQDGNRIKVGDEYQFHARLKRIHGLRNPGGFDYEAYANMNHIRASGSVIAKMPVKYLGHDFLYMPVNQIRQVLQTRILEHLPTSDTSPWLLALMIGERSLAPQSHWQILRATGTNHLMAIAGLHIGLISGFIHLMVNFLWRKSVRLTGIYPAQLAAASAAISAAWLYSGIAGFSIPTERACLMVTFIIAALLMKRKLPSWHAWGSALIVVIIINPLSVLSESFWLSFGTIALIIFGMCGRLSPGGLWWKWGRVQWVIGFGLIPLSLFFFQQASMVSVAANSIAIPWLGFTILPFCLLADVFLLISPDIAILFLWIADKSLAALWIMLSWFAHIDFAVYSQSIPNLWLLMSTIFGCVILLLPSGAPGKSIGLIWLLPLMLYQHPVPYKNDYWLTILDVGQGLAVVVQTQHHTLLFDAGPKLGSFDAGESVVIPYLNYQGIKSLDMMVISHGDNDHIGGAEYVQRNMKVKSILTSAVEKFSRHSAMHCAFGTKWEWDGVTFQILYPFTGMIQIGNDSSCVLRIDNGRHRILLTGDIEKFAENQLLQNRNISLNANIIAAPHHGSKTSSQKKFLAAVRPNAVIFATGYKNRYHFPHPTVIQHYSEIGSVSYNTMETGALTFKLEKSKSIVFPKMYRYEYLHYWHDVVS